VEIGTEAELFPEKEYIYGIFVAVKTRKTLGKVSDIPTHDIPFSPVTDLLGDYLYYRIL